MIIFLKESGKHNSPELLSMLFDTFKIRSLVCIGVQVFVFMQNTAILAMVILLLKLAKTLLNIWQLFSSGSLKVLKIGIWFFRFEIANTILSKVLIRFVAVSIALDAIIAVVALYAELIVAMNPFVEILDQACNWNEMAIDGIELVGNVVEAERVAKDILSNEDEVKRAVEEILQSKNDINNLINELNNV